MIPNCLGSSPNFHGSDSRATFAEVQILFAKPSNWRYGLMHPADQCAMRTRAGFLQNRVTNFSLKFGMVASSWSSQQKKSGGPPWGVMGARWLLCVKKKGGQILALAILTEVLSRRPDELCQQIFGRTHPRKD